MAMKRHRRYPTDDDQDQRGSSPRIPNAAGRWTKRTHAVRLDLRDFWPDEPRAIVVSSEGHSAPAGGFYITKMSGSPSGDLQISPTSHAS
jgi:hypothetical protein